MGELRELWVNLRSATPSHTRVRLLSLAGAALFALALVLAGDVGPVAWAGTLVLGALVVCAPSGAMPTVFVLWAVGAWWAGSQGTWHWALLPAAWGLLMVHASAALAASVPAQASLPRSVLSRYAWRALVVGGLTTVVWGLAGLLAGGSGPGPGVVPGIVGLAVLVAAVGGYLRLRGGQS